MRRKHSAPKRKGVTLILALMVMSAVIAIGITIVAIVVFQTRINATTTQGQQGYYAAESGIEQALSKVVSLRSGALGAAETAIQNAQAPKNPDGSTPFPFNLDLTTAVSSGTVVQKELKQNQSAIVEIYNVDDSLDALPGAPSLCVYAEGDGNDDGNEILEISWVAWGSLAGSFSTSATQRVLAHYSAFNTGGTCPIPGTAFLGFVVPLDQFYPAFSVPYSGFRIRITALTPNSGNGDVHNLHISSSPQLNSHLRIKSTSRSAFSNQQQALLAVVPWSVPLSSLFDFVIFSEQDLTKNLPQSKSDEIRRYGPFAAPANVWTDVPNQGSSDPSINPFTNCAGTCTYFVRLENASAGVWNTGVDMRQNDTVNSPPTQQNATLPIGATCILPKPFTFTTGGTPPVPPNEFLSTSAHLAGQNYYLLSHLTFRDPTEGYCSS